MRRMIFLLLLVLAVTPVIAQEATADVLADFASIHPCNSLSQDDWVNIYALSNGTDITQQIADYALQCAATWESTETMVSSATQGFELDVAIKFCSHAEFISPENLPKVLRSCQQALSATDEMQKKLGVMDYLVIAAVRSGWNHNQLWELSDDPTFHFADLVTPDVKLAENPMGRELLWHQWRWADTFGMKLFAYEVAKLLRDTASERNPAYWQLQEYILWTEYNQVVPRSVDYPNAIFEAAHATCRLTAIQILAGSIDFSLTYPLDSISLSECGIVEKAFYLYERAFASKVGPDVAPPFGMDADLVEAPNLHMSALEALGATSQSDQVLYRCLFGLVTGAEGCPQETEINITHAQVILDFEEILMQQ